MLPGQHSSWTWRTVRHSQIRLPMLDVKNPVGHEVGVHRWVLNSSSQVAVNSFVVGNACCRHMAVFWLVQNFLSRYAYNVARVLKLQTIAEWVEDEAVLGSLKRNRRRLCSGF